MTKVIKVFSFIVIFLFLLSVFGWMSYHISKGDKKFGFLTEPVKFMYSFLDTFSKSVEEVKTIKYPGTFIKTPPDFKPINKLDFDVIALSTYSDTSDSRSCILINLRNDSILHKWVIENPHGEVRRIFNPLLLPDKNLIYSFADATGLRRIDAQSNQIWKQDSIWAHHAMNLDADGNIWTCSMETVWFATGLYKQAGRSVFYIDNYITKINSETGRILFHKSITEILLDNNLSNYILKSDNIIDPFHLNDVEPALKTTKYYNKGDLFISTRQLSLIIHYRPSTNKIIDMIEGPFISQHDVDFLNDGSLVIFNNNYYTMYTKNSMDPPKDSTRLMKANDFYSNIVKYDFTDESFSFIGDSVFRANGIFTMTEGLMDFLDSSTYFVEEQNPGVLWLIKNDEVIYKNVFKSQHEEYHHLPNWTRIIKDYD